MARKKPAAIVAELGRPETDAEKAARKARDSYLYKKRKTVNNLVYSLLVCLGLLLLIVLIVPRGTGDYLSRNVDVVSLAKSATTSAGQNLAAPQMPEGWLAKQAQLRFDKDEQVSYWYIGYTTPSGNYAAVFQGSDSKSRPADARWVTKQLEKKQKTGSIKLAGFTWDVYDYHRDSPDNSNVLWGFVTEIDSATLIVSGTGTKAEITSLLKATVASLKTDSAAVDQERSG